VAPRPCPLPPAPYARTRTRTRIRTWPPPPRASTYGASVNSRTNCRGARRLRRQRVFASM
jgi:hypothetical protein